MPSTAGYTFAFGVSAFMPYADTAKSASLAYKESDTYSVTQPGEIFVKVLDSASGAVVVLHLPPSPYVPSACIRPPSIYR